MPGKTKAGSLSRSSSAFAGEIVGGFFGSFIGLGKVESFDLGGIFIATILLLIILSIAQKEIVAIRGPCWSRGWGFIVYGQAAAV